VHAAGLAGSTGAGTRRLAEDGAVVIRSAAGILADWGWKSRAATAASADVRARIAPRGTAEAGAEIARLAAAEIDGAGDARIDRTYGGA
jgi:hypothetical protein